MKIILITLVLGFLNCNSAASSDSSSVTALALAAGLATVKASSSSTTSAQTCAQSAANPVATASAVGGSCATPTLTNLGDGTVKDTANNILWIRCLLDMNGPGGSVQVKESSLGNCSGATASSVFFQVPGNTQGSDMCSSITYAGRTGWSLPDLTQLGAYYKATASSLPYIYDTNLQGATAFSGSQFYYLTTTIGTGSKGGYVDFSRPTGTGGGPQLLGNSQSGIVLCLIKL